MPELWPLITATFLLAGMVKGLIGLGLPTVAMGLLGLVMPTNEAAVLLLVPSMVTNVSQLLAGPALRPLIGRLWPMLLGIIGGTWAGAGMLARAAPGAVGWLGLALMTYGLIGLSRVQLAVPLRAERWAAPVVGVSTGLIGGATGVFVIPAVPYVSSLGFERDVLVQAMGLFFTVATVALAAGLAWHGALPATGAGVSVLAMVPALGGMAVGGWLRTRVRPALFRTCFFTGLLGLGAELAWRGLMPH